MTPDAPPPSRTASEHQLGADEEAVRREPPTRQRRVDGSKYSLADAFRSNVDAASVAHENGIVWIADVMSLPYVRETLALIVGRRRRPPERFLGRVVGYATLGPGARAEVAGVYRRRVFWVARHDRDSEPGGIYATNHPLEAVDPRTVAPGRPGTPPTGEAAHDRWCPTLGAVL